MNEPTEMPANPAPRLELLLPAPDSPRLARLDDLLDDWQTDAEAAFEARRTGTPRGPVTGLPRLDRALGGMLEPGLHVVHGPPGAGKTAKVLQVAATCATPALLITTEMSALELFRRHAARVTGTYLGRLKSGELSPADSLELARRAIEAAPELAIADATLAPASGEWVLKAARAVRGEAAGILLALDSLHTWAEGLDGAGATEYDALNAALGELRSISAQLACPVLVVAERNRASMQAGGLSAAAGTRKIEYGATTVMELVREEVPEDALGEIPIKLKLAKNRNGAAGRIIDLRFHGALQRFREAP